jgi:hypothetical protein
VLAVALASQLRTQFEQAISQTAPLLAGIAALEPFLWLRPHAEQQADGRAGVPAPDRLHRGVWLRELSFRYPGGRIATRFPA